MVPTSIWISIPIHRFNDPVDRTRSISTVDKDSPTGEYDYRRSIRIHLKRIMVDRRLSIKNRDNFVVDFIDDTCGQLLRRHSAISLFLDGCVRICRILRCSEVAAFQAWFAALIANTDICISQCLLTPVWMLAGFWKHCNSKAEAGRDLNDNNLMDRSSCAIVRVHCCSLGRDEHNSPVYAMRSTWDRVTSHEFDDDAGMHICKCLIRNVRVFVCTCVYVCSVCLCVIVSGMCVCVRVCAIAYIMCPSLIQAP